MISAVQPFKISNIDTSKVFNSEINSLKFSPAGNYPVFAISEDENTYFLVADDRGVPVWIRMDSCTII